MKVGLALGSGSARGWAHIGIIEALEEMDIQISAISGCSIGAYVGAAYCNGKLSELKDWVLSLNEWQVIKLMGVSLPKGGLVSGEKVFTTLEERFVPATIEELALPFSAVATDMRRGQEIIFNSGSTVDAVRASCSIPGLFPPHEYRNRLLLDGAVVNPVPVSLCRQLGVDAVIAVDLSVNFGMRDGEFFDDSQKQNDDKFNNFFQKTFDSVSGLFGKNKDESGNGDQLERPSILNTMTNSIDIMQHRLTRSRLASDPPDVLLKPHLDHIGIMEFHRGEESIAIGRKAVERMAEQIRYQLYI